MRRTVNGLRAPALPDMVLTFDLQFGIIDFRNGGFYWWFSLKCQIFMFFNTPPLKA